MPSEKGPEEKPKNTPEILKELSYKELADDESEQKKMKEMIARLVKEAKEAEEAKEAKEAEANLTPGERLKKELDLEKDLKEVKKELEEIQNNPKAMEFVREVNKKVEDYERRIKELKSRLS